jgi:alpha-beta hydrolase superfamily lysophospholipase
MSGGTLTGARSVRLSYRTWLPDEGGGQPRAAVVLAHGYGEHIGRYGHVVGALVGHGYAVYALDHRGHGASDGARANVERFDYFVTDLDQLVELVRRAHPGLPLFLIGHSMGGLIATLYVQRYAAKVDGLVLSGVALYVERRISPLLRLCSAVLARVAPGFPIMPLSREGESVLSSDPAVQVAFDADPLCYKGPLRVRMGYELVRAMERARRQLSAIRVPLLIMHGEEDRLVSPEGSRRLYDEAASANKTLKLWPGCRHEIFNERCKDEVIAFLCTWLDERVRQAGTRSALASRLAP